MGKDKICPCSIKECEQYANQVYCKFRFTSYEILTIKQAVMIAAMYLSDIDKGVYSMPEVWEDEDLPSLKEMYRALGVKIERLIGKVDAAEEKEPGAASSMFFSPNRFQGLEIYYIHLAFQVYFWFVERVQAENMPEPDRLGLSFQELERDAKAVYKKINALLAMVE